MDRLVGALFEDINIDAGGLWIDYRAGQVRNSVANAVSFSRSCVVQALSCGDGSHHSLHAWA